MNLLLPLLLQGLALLVPGLSPRVTTAIAAVLPAAMKVVDDLSDATTTGATKREAAIHHIEELLDDQLDDVPEWAALGEEKRDRMLAGLVEWAVWLGSLTDRKERRKVRAALPKS